VPAVNLETSAWLRTEGRAAPERWVWSVAALGWVVLTTPLWSRLFGVQAPVGVHHLATMSQSDMPRHMQMEAASATSWWSELGGHLVMWTAMVLATMLPLIAWNLRRVGQRSPHHRRIAATVEVAAGWAAVWLGTGALLSAGILAMTLATGQTFVVVVGVGLAVAWQFTAVRRVAVARCHRTFAPPLGRTARRSCVGFGGTLGRDCVVSCWAGMAVMAASGHRLAVVLPVAWLSWRDRRRPHDRPGTKVSVVVLVLAGLVTLVVPGSW
jgi:predicted metal-binding membrane protein